MFCAIFFKCRCDKTKSMNENRKNADGRDKDFEISPAFRAEKKSAVYNVWQVFKHNLLKPQEYRIVAAGYADPGCSVRDATPKELKSRVMHANGDAREIMMVLDGECEILIGDRVVSGSSGTLMLVNVGERHQLGYPPNSRSSRHVWITFWPHYITFALISDSGSTQRSMPVFRNYRYFDQYIINSVFKAWDALLADDVSEENLAEFKALIRLLSVKLAKMYDDAIAEESRLSADERRGKKLSRVMRYIEVQSGRNCNTNTLAQLAGYSRTHFVRLFRDYVGCSVLDYINGQRRARYHALHDHAPLKIVAEQLGFHSEAAFIHWRKQNIGKLPPSDD